MSERSVLLGILGLQLTVTAIGLAIFAELHVSEWAALLFFGGLVVMFGGWVVTLIEVVLSGD